MDRSETNPSLKCIFLIMMFRVLSIFILRLKFDYFASFILALKWICNQGKQKWGQHSALHNTCPTHIWKIHSFKNYLNNKCILSYLKNTFILTCLRNTFLLNYLKNTFLLTLWKCITFELFEKWISFRNYLKKLIYFRSYLKNTFLLNIIWKISVFWVIWNIQFL